MDSKEISGTVAVLLTELLDGTQARGGYVLNGGDPGLMRSLDRLSAEEASATAAGGASIAAHVDHLRFSMSLYNRWANGEENPWQGADWTGSWRMAEVTEDEWRELRHQLRSEVTAYLEGLRNGRELSDIERNGMVGGVAHFAYHVGAIRQMNKAVKGPKAEG